MNDTISETTFGDDAKGIACGILIPATIEEFTVIAGRTSLALCSLLHKWFYDALQEEGVLAKPRHVALGENSADPVTIAWKTNKGALLFHVTEWKRGFAVIRDRFTALGLLEFTHMSYLDFAEGIWRPLYPQNRPTFYMDEWLKQFRPPGPPAP